MSEMIDYIQHMEHCLKKGQSFEWENKIYDLKQRQHRIACIKEWIEQCEVLPPNKKKEQALEKLADLILHEELCDMNAHKVRQEEYPIMSTWQIKLRQKREYNIKLADEMNLDMQSCQPPVRRKRTAWEEWSREKGEHERLLSFNPAYKLFVQHSQVKVNVVK
ncbi:hypothetical protein [Longirhabdus pacifica]|uniref:hypothetical protein n=1 Tax=Longirhabdus pacifica TaxID=2305227 RepID=UPI001008A4AD|nr:hypothetical protein [Longirhabdus pacifica]